jgi:hypothetical protein
VVVVVLTLSLSPLHDQTEWMKNGEHLVKREAAVLALPTGLERMLIEQQQQQRRGGDEGHHRRDRQLAANATDRMLPG